MLYPEFINKICDLVITEADNGLFYLEPMWETILRENGIKPAEFGGRLLSTVLEGNDDFIFETGDGDIAKNKLLEILELEVKKRNTVNSITPYVLRWVHDIISASVEPAVLEEEIEYLKNYREYKKANAEAKATEGK